MCFPNKKSSGENKLEKYKEDGTVTETESDKNTHIPDNLPDLIHDPSLNSDLQEGVHALVFENGNEIIVVYTSDEAFELYNAN